MHLMHSVRRVGQGSVDGLYAYVGIGQGRARRQEDIGAGYVFYLADPYGPGCVQGIARWVLGYVFYLADPYGPGCVQSSAVGTRVLLV